MKHKSYTKLCLLFVFAIFVSENAYGQNIPASADSGTILRREKFPTIQSSEHKVFIPKSEINSSMPAEAEDIFFPFNLISIDGMTAFKPDKFLDSLEEFSGKNTPVSLIWDTAQKITKAYRDKGYFLSRAYIPEQEIQDGYAQINVIEGHISATSIEGDSASSSLVQNIIQGIKRQKPLNFKFIESALLRLNDIHGVEFDATLGKTSDGKYGTVELELADKPEPSRGVVSVNNYGSRFSGPLRSNMVLQHSFFKGHQTSLNTSASLPSAKELWLVGLSHGVQIAPDLELGFLVSRSNTAPGFTLTDNDIESESTSMELNLKWKPIRQRNKNLQVSFALDALNSKTDILKTALTRDNVRAARLSLDYDFLDKYSGLNFMKFKLSKGIEGLNSSQNGDLNLSRADADPGFTKLEAFYRYQKFINSSVLLTTQLQGQYAFAPVYASEEFGFGGIYLGRGYDFSEITGDHGLAGSIEFQYVNLPSVYNHKMHPFVFYDVAKAWNKGALTLKDISASSGGFGARFFNNKGLSFDTTLAFPLTKSIDNPLYGNGKTPIFRFGLTYQFDF